MKRNFRAWLGLSAAIWLVTVYPAVADPTRDQVMDGAARCEGIPDNRVWLDCFYGSAQPFTPLADRANVMSKRRRNSMAR